MLPCLSMQLKFPTRVRPSLMPIFIRRFSSVAALLAFGLLSFSPSLPPEPPPATICPAVAAASDMESSERNPGRKSGGGDADWEVWEVRDASARGARTQEHGSAG
eukprot:CAMPEP_0182882076 /NCGR_PEP_ID=MMETSP0034_2-20130328/17562_1 /TAXON_ID=156128 /ORGANISM="Nephroselmis pyriformis, Strain CCMP717" /LENGTH=104 /DNA_ID=CAMNT_0025015141 /DNA_START=282 /DNA_END=594 /DNA_ORIENTATION=-